MDRCRLNLGNGASGDRAQCNREVAPRVVSVEDSSKSVTEKSRSLEIIDLRFSGNFLSANVAKKTLVNDVPPIVRSLPRTKVPHTRDSWLGLRSKQREGNSVSLPATFFDTKRGHFSPLTGESFYNSRAPSHRNVAPALKLHYLFPLSAGATRGETDPR